MMSREGREFARRSWQRHPVLSGIYVVVAVGFGVLGVIDLVDGHSRLRGGLYLVLWIAWFILLVVLVRRDEPPSEQKG